MPLNLSKWTVAGIYFFACLLMSWPYIDLVSNAWPLQLGNAEWRYGAAGLLAAYHHTPILGFLVALGLAVREGHQGVLRSLGVLGLVWGVGVILVAGAFALDLLQVRDLRPPEVQGAILVGGIIAGLKHGTAAIALLLLGTGCWIGSRKAPVPQKSSGPGVVVGRQ